MLRFCLRLTIVALIAVALAMVGVVLWIQYKFPPERVDIAAADRPADQRLLFIGNSFTNNNGLDQMVEALVREMNPENDDILAIRVAPNGYMLVDHVADLTNATDNPPLRQVLLSGSDTLRDWDLVVIQGQSEIMGFSNSAYEKERLLQAAPTLATAARDTGAMTLLLMTWGYSYGDDWYPDIYPDYLTMQTRLQQGYDHLASVLSNDGHGKVYVAPAGLGFQAVYDDVNQTQRSPLAKNAPFRRLYTGDGRHPSTAGTYLAACVITATYTGQPVSSLTWTPNGLDRDFATYLRSVADQVVFGNRYGALRLPPWN